MLRLADKKFFILTDQSILDHSHANDVPLDTCTETQSAPHDESKHEYNMRNGLRYMYIIMLSLQKFKIS